MEPRAVREIVKVVLLAIGFLDRDLPLESKTERERLSDPALRADPVFVRRVVVALERSEKRRLGVFPQGQVERGADLQVRRELERGRLELDDVRLGGRVIR